MSTKKRKVSFYLLTLAKGIKSENNKKLEFKSCSNSEIEERFKYLYENKMRLVNMDKSRAIDIKTGNGTYVIEVVDYNNHYAFAKIGNQNSSNTVALRDQFTLESQDVPMEVNQTLELYTLFLIDFNTGVVSYIGLNGTPKISVIRDLFELDMEKDTMSARLSAILNRNVVDMVSKKKQLGKAVISIAIPSDEELSRYITDKVAYDELRNIKETKLELCFKPERNKPLFDVNEKFLGWVRKMLNLYGEKVQKFSINAKDNNEDMQVYNLLSSKMTSSVILGGDKDYRFYNIEDFKNVLKETYEKNKEDLKRNIRTD